MKVWVGIVLFGALSILSAAGDSEEIDDCPPGQYSPGPDCSFEAICPIPSAHTYRRHYCDCWCNPGTTRDSLTHKCVKKCPTYYPYQDASSIRDALNAVDV